MKIRIPCKSNVEVRVYRIFRNNKRKKNEKLIEIDPVKNDEQGKTYELMPGEYEIRIKIHLRKRILEGRRSIKVRETIKPEITDDKWNGDFNPNFEVL
jgi:hypothetical protein